MNLRNVTIILSIIILLGMMTFVGHKATYRGITHFMAGMAFFLPFYGTPLIVSIVLSIVSKNSFSQGILATTSLLYGIWFAYAMYFAFYVHLDPQSGLIILFVGIYSLPVMLPAWITAYVLDRNYAKKTRAGVPAKRSLTTYH